MEDSGIKEKLLSNGVVEHTIAPVWNKDSRILILGTMPSPASRKAGFFYMHPQNRFWKVLSSVFNETFVYPNNYIQKELCINERKDFLLRHNLALWDVAQSCSIKGASDSSIRGAVPNDFSCILNSSSIKYVAFTGKTSYILWKKLCSSYEKNFNLNCYPLPSTSSANAAWSIDKLVKAYSVLASL